MDTKCEASTPPVNEAVLPLPEFNCPVDETPAVPVNVFGPDEQKLLFASRAVNLTGKGIPVTCVPMFPPPNDSTRKLEAAPGTTIKSALGSLEVMPSVTVIEVASDFFKVVDKAVVETPLEKLTEVV